MKNTMKKLVTLVAMMSMLCMVLAGCGTKLAPADETISALYDLYVKQDAEPIVSLLGFESEEVAFDAFFAEDVDPEATVNEMVDMFSQMGVEMTEEETQAFTDSMIGMIDRAECTAEITSEEGDTTVVTLSIKGFDVNEISNTALETVTEMVNNMTEEEALALSTDEEAYNDYMKQVVQLFTDGFNAAVVSEEAVEVEVECQKLAVDNNGKEIVAWLPVDMDGFASDVEAAVFQQ